MHKALVNNSYQFDIDLVQDLKQLDVLCLSSGNFHVIKDNKSYHIVVIKTDLETKNIVIGVNGEHYTVSLQDEMDILLQKLGLEKLKASKINDLKAPMPGLVLDIKVQTGQQIKKGEPLLVLEAMKMENVLKAVGDGIIKSIEVNKGDAVEKGSILINFQ